jgi:hypothetical protein
MDRHLRLKARTTRNLLFAYFAGAFSVVAFGLGAVVCLAMTRGAIFW